MKPLIIALLILFGLANAYAEKSANDVTVEVFHVTVSSGKQQASKDSPAGVSILRDRFDIVEKSLGIPLLKGHGFAVTFTLSGKYKDLEKVRLLVKFPEMKEPSGEVHSQVDRIQKSLLIDGVRMVAFSYAFDEDWELIEGIWTVQIFDGKQQLGEVQLITFNPKKKEANQSLEPTRMNDSSAF